MLALLLATGWGPVGGDLLGVAADIAFDDVVRTVDEDVAERLDDAARAALDAAPGNCDQQVRLFMSVVEEVRLDAGYSIEQVGAAVDWEPTPFVDLLLQDCQ